MSHDPQAIFFNHMYFKPLARQLFLQKNYAFLRFFSNSTKRSHLYGVHFSHLFLVGSLANGPRWSPVPARWFRWVPLPPRMGPTVMIRSRSRRCGETPRRLLTGFWSKRAKPSQNQRTKQQNDLMDIWWVWWVWWIWWIWWIWWMGEYIYFFRRKEFASGLRRWLYV